MTNRKSYGKRISAFLLCTIMLLTIFSASPVFTSANEFAVNRNNIVPLSLSLYEDIDTERPDEEFSVNVSVNSPALGTAESSVSFAEYGVVVELSATPASGNRFVRWEVIEGNAYLSNSESPDTYFIMPSGNVSISAVFSMGTGVISGNNIALHHIIEEGVVSPILTSDVLSQIISSENRAFIAFDLTQIDSVSAISFSVTALERISLAGFGIEAIMQHGLITLNRQLLTSIVAQTVGTTVTIYFHTVTRSELTDTQQHVLSTYDSVYAVQIMAGTYTVTSFNGVLTVVVSYAGQLPVGVWRLFGNGRLEEIPSTHNATRLTVSFTPSSLSLFVVGIDHNAVQIEPIEPEIIPPPPDILIVENPFSDVSSEHWFYDDVLFVFSRYIMGATGIDPNITGANNMLFSPNAALTRGMIVTILHRMEGTPISTAANPFADVAANTWYFDAVVWAAAAGIVTGVAEGRFDPGANITRQDLAVIFVRYARYTNTNLLPINSFSAFSDQSAISAYAIPSVRQAVQSGIMGGTADNRFAPHDNATRAQTAAMIHRFMSLGSR